MFKRFALLLTPMFASLLMALTVGGTLAASPNLIPNPSVETADSTGTKPVGWNQDKWGTNTSTFTYKTNAGYSGSISLYINMTKRSSGDAKWYFTHIPVKPNQKYTYSEFYKSNVTTEIDAEYLSTSGKYSYAWLGSQAASATNWKSTTVSFTTPSEVNTLTVFHVINKVGWLQTDDFSLVEGDGTTPPPPATPPTVSITSPPTGATVANSQTINANANDSVGVAGVQFKVDGINVGAEDTSAPYSASWDTKTASNGNHTITAFARNISGLTATASEPVNVQNLTPPTVSFTLPIADATVSGTSQAVSASASADTVGIQFKLDGNNLGTEDMAAPYNINWDTTTASNDSHTLSAVARNAAGLTATVTETVNVQNTVTPPPPSTTNLIPNSSLETAQDTSTPQGWLASKWGSNTSTFSYLTSGHTGNRSVKVETSSYSSGAVNWYYNGASVTAGKTYKYENWYQSNVDTEVDAEVVMSDGSIQYYWLGNALANTNWTKFSATFIVPTGAKSLTIYQLLAKKGYLISDDYYLSEYAPAQFNQGIVSLTFDDAWRSQYTNALPLLQKYNLPATFYLLTGEVNDPDYMTVAMMQALKDQGSEIASHTITHPHLPQLSVVQIDTELANSQASLRQWFGPSVASGFATPYGEYDSTVLTEIKKYYRSHRGVEEGFNSKDNFDIYDIKVQNITSNTTPAQVQAWVGQAAANKTWLVLVYHEIGANVGGDIYHTNTANLDQELNALKQSGVAVETVEQALNEILAQL